MGLHFQRGILPIYKKVLRQEAQSWKAETLSTIAIPISFFLAFGLGLEHYMSKVDGMSYMTFLTPGLVTMTVMFEAYRTGAWGLWLDRWYQKMINEYRIKPISTSDIIIGEILGGFVVALAKGLIVGTILLALAPMTLDWRHLGPYLLYMAAGSILFTCAGTMVGTLCRKPDQIAQTQTIVITPLLYLGGLFFPLSAFPKSILPFIRWFPTTALFDGGRNAMLFGQIAWPEFIALWAIALFSFALATTLFNRKLSE